MVVIMTSTTAVKTPNSLDIIENTGASPLPSNNTPKREAIEIKRRMFLDVYKRQSLYRDMTEWVLQGWYFNDFERNPKDFEYYKQRIAAIPIHFQPDYLDVYKRQVCNP